MPRVETFVGQVHPGWTQFHDQAKYLTHARGLQWSDCQNHVLSWAFKLAMLRLTVNDN